MLIWTKRKEVRVMSVKHIVDILSLDGKQDTFGKINLRQLGRLVCSPGHIIESHTHLNWFELTSVTGGEGEIYGGDTKVNIKKGEIFLSFPCEIHKIVSSVENPLTFEHFAFYTTDEAFCQQLEVLMASYADARSRLFKSYLIKEMLTGCVNEVAQNTRFRKDYLESGFSLVLLELLKIFESRRSSVFITDEGYQDPERLCLSVKNYIDTHLFSIKKLSDLSEKCGYNYSYLSSLFRTVTGITLSEYYNERRFESAKLMIWENKLKIGEISNLLGYNSVYAFSKAFKDRVGASPKKFLSVK